MKTGIKTENEIASEVETSNVVAAALFPPADALDVADAASVEYALGEGDGEGEGE